MNTISLYQAVRSIQYFSLAGISSIGRFCHRPNLRLPFHPRFYSKEDKPLTYIPHNFTYEEACKKFVEEDSKRLFAPKNIPNLQPALLPDSEKNTLRKVLLPFFGVNASIKSNTFYADYGYTRTYTTSSTDDKGNTTTTVHTYIEWHHINGSLGACHYAQEDDGMCIYGGFTWDSRPIEKGIGSWKFTHNLQSFDPSTVDSSTFVDPFLKRVAIAQEIGTQRIKNCEESRIESEIYSRTGCDHISIKSYQLDWGSFNTTSFLLPAYILQYPNCPPRIMAALNKEIVKVTGVAPLSIPKVMSVTTVATTIFSLLFPEVAIPVRIAAILASTATSGFWARYRLSINYSFQQGHIEEEKKRNESVSETISDKRRRQETEKVSASAESFFHSRFLDVDSNYFQLLGIDSGKSVTEENIRRAFIERIKHKHPDQQSGSLQEAQNLVSARDEILKAIRKREVKFGETKRNYSTKKQCQVKEPPRSIYGPNAKKLIDLVLVQKNYKAALQMVEKDEVHPDAHDKNENTLLTEAAKRRDHAAMRFAVVKLGADPDTSCDCPAHRTALDYAVMNRDFEGIKLLLVLKANPNLINSNGETPLDIAITKGYEAIKLLLIESGAVQHRTVEGSEGFWRKVRGSILGYGSQDRTRLLGRENESDKETLEEKKVIYLPSSKKEEE